MNEADTCRKFVIPKLQAAGWDNEPHSIAEQRTITDGRIVPGRLAFNAPLRTRRERAQRLCSVRKDFFEQHGPEARQILDELLEKYAEHGAAQLLVVRKHLPDVLKVPPVSDHGQIGDITKLFGGADKLRGAVNELQTLLYAA
jgi:type I restriction enzyme, R subunit